MNTPSIDELAKAAIEADERWSAICTVENMNLAKEARRIFRNAALPSAWLSLSSRVEALEGALKFADEHAKKIEALLDPHIKWNDPKPDGEK